MCPAETTESITACHPASKSNKEAVSEDAHVESSPNHDKQAVDRSFPNVNDDSLFTVRGADTAGTILGDASTWTGTSPASNNSENTPPPLHKPLEGAERPNNTSSMHFTMGKLNYGGSGVRGRSNEEAKLKNALLQMEAKREKRLLFISGYSGTGKSALANTLRGHLSDNSRRKSRTCITGEGMMVKGKFDRCNLSKNEPYSGIASACGNICGEILALREQDETKGLFERVQRALHEELGNEIPILTRAIPILEELMEDFSSSSRLLLNGSKTSGQESGVNVPSSVDTKHRFNFAFQRFIRVVATAFQPLVVVLDDLQWADAPSLDLVEAVMTDRHNSNILLIGIYRSNEVDDRHTLNTLVESLQRRGAADKFCVQTIEIGNLDFDSVHKIVQDLLLTTDSRTVTLAEVCHKKTDGNAFYLLQFLSMLYQSGLLTYNYGQLKWTWDASEIERSTMATNNVVDLLQRKMSDLPSHQREVLHLASYLGAKFQEQTLLLVWQNLSADKQREQPTGDQCQDLEAALTSLLLGGYLNGLENGEFSFTHDRVQEAASCLLPLSERHEYSQRVGSVLVSNLEPVELEATVFVAVNLLNTGDRLVVEMTGIDLAELNLKACKKAVLMSAFDAAANYAAKGIDLLGESGWKDHYELRLELYSTGMKAEACLGRIDRVENYYTKIVAQTDRPIEDKLRAYSIWFDCVANLGRYKEASQNEMEVLAKFGCCFPKHRIGFMWRMLMGIGMAKKLVKRGRLDDIQNREIVTEQTRLSLLHILDRLATHLYMCGSDLLALVTFRNLQWTLKYGLNDFSAASIATAGIILAGALDDLQGGAILAKSALELAPKLSPSTECRTLLVAHGFVLHWTQPLKDQLQPLRRAYELGLRAGDTENACWAIVGYCMVRIVTSFRVDLIAADCNTFLPQMKDLKHDSAYRHCILHHQMHVNMLNQDAGGEVAYWGDILKREVVEQWKQEDAYYSLTCDTWHGYLYMIYGEYEKCVQLALKRGPEFVKKAAPGNITLYIDTLSKGLSAFAAARQTRNRRYFKIGKLFHRRVKGWIKKGNPNVVHYGFLFDAEIAAFKGRKLAATQKYNKAVVMSARAGLLMDAGLCSERFGEYLLEQSNGEDGRYQIVNAVKYFREVGANRKVSMLEGKHSDIQPTPVEVYAETGMDREPF